MPKLKFHIFGLRTEISITVLIWPILLFYAFGGTIKEFTWEPLQMAFYVSLSIWIAILLHELGHAAGAHMVDIETEKIEISAIMGKASIAWPEEGFNPKRELLPLALGPLTNLFVSGVFWGMSRFFSYDPVLEGMCFIFVGIHAAIGIFNLVPTLPMDGAKILLCLHALLVPPIVAARRVATVGTIAALGLLYVAFQNGYILVIGLSPLFILANIFAIKWPEHLIRSPIRKADSMDQEMRHG